MPRRISMKLTQLKLSKIVELLPMMSEEEYGMLKADIKENGIKEPLVVFNKEVVDGRHRYLAAKELKIKDVPVKEIEEPEEGLETYVLSLNLSRRHLNAGQRVLVYLETRMVCQHTKKVSADTICKMAGVSINTVKRVKYIIKYGNDNEKELIRSGKAEVKTVQREIKKRISPPKEKTTVLPKLDTTSSNTITTKVAVANTGKSMIVNQEKLDYINKRGNAIQRQAAKANPNAIDGIYNSITTKDQASITPTPMPTIVPPTPAVSVDWEAKYREECKKVDETLDMCMKLEQENITLKAAISKLKGDVVQKDYTVIEGKYITPEELDKVGLVFSDYPTYVRLMKEYQENIMEEYRKGFK